MRVDGTRAGLDIWPDFGMLALKFADLLGWLCPDRGAWNFGRAGLTARSPFLRPYFDRYMLRFDLAWK